MFALALIHTSNSPVPLVICAALGVALFCQGFLLLRRKRLIMNTPVSKVRSAAMGLVEINGLAAGPYTFTAPITGMPCYYSRTVVWQWKREGRNTKWVREADDCQVLPFYVEDETGRVLVDPKGAQLDIHRDFQEEFGSVLFVREAGLPPNVASFLLQHGISTEKKIKVEEYCIKPKNALFVLGTLAHNPGLQVTAVPMRGKPRVSLSLNLSVNSSLIGSNEFTAGVAERPAGIKVTNAFEEMKSGAAFGMAAGSSSSSGAVSSSSAVLSPDSQAGSAQDKFDLRPATLIMKGTHDSSFFISWRSQKEIVGALAWRSVVMIWGGPAVTLLCVYLLAARYGWL
jgi:hypothetical protein